jgi:predicted nucleic acid-binding protein
VCGFLLDTNVASELMRREPAPVVLAWFARQSDARYYVASVVVAEILLGVALLPKGRRRDDLADAATALFDEEFTGRVLAFDDVAAADYAALVAARTRAGRPISLDAAQIAAVALTHALPLVTRNTADFDGIAGLAVINPWQQASI